MSYTIERIEKELVTAYELHESARKHAQAMQKLADGMHPERPAFMSRFVSDDEKPAAKEAWAQYSAACDKWTEEYAVPAAKCAEKEKAAALYVKAVSEMLEKAIMARINGIIVSDAFLEKYDGVPVRYKKLQKALFGGFDSRYHFYFKGVWNCRIGYTFRPDPENYHMSFDGDFYYYGDYSANGDTCISAEEVRKRVKGEAEYYEKGLGAKYEQPTFAAVQKACNKAAKIAHKHDEILTAAAAKAETLVSSNSCGLSVVRAAMQGEKDINYRR